MNKKILISFAVLTLAVSALALAPQGGKFGQKEALLRDTDTWIDANLILMFVTNKGSFGYDQGGQLGKNDGLYFPFTGLENILDKSQFTSSIFAAGVWMGAVDSATADTLITVAEYSDDYFPGPMVGGTFLPAAENGPSYKVYKLYSDSLADNPNDDYLNWPVSQGAPVDSTGAPQMLGDQMLWSVYNDADPSTHTNDASSTTGLGVEVRQTTFAFAREGALANIIFLKFQIYNSGGLNLKDMFVSLWADPDLGNAGDDFVGCDTLLSLGYCYNDGIPDASYGDAPPAVGFDFFQGPLVFTGNATDTAIMWNFTKFPGYQNMPMTSFNKYINGTDPQNYVWTYQYMNGLDASNGGAPNPNGTKFAVPGDPVANTGDLDVNSSDRRYLLTTGPFDFAPGDSTEVVAAIIVGQGADQLNSVTQLKLLDEFAQTVYDRSFILPDPPARPVVEVAELDEEIVLTWGTDSEDDPGDYQFEGYAVFQGASAAGPWTDTLGWFDYNNGVGAIIDSFFNLNTGNYFPRIVKPGRDKGLQRYWRATADRVNGGPIINYTDYYFRVEAYSFDTTAVKGERVLTSATVVRAMPQPPRVGTDYTQEFGNELPDSHVGPSDGSLTVQVIDPSELTDNDYIVVFSNDTALGIVWHIINTTTGDTVLSDQTNQAGDESYVVVDGFLAKVKGPDPGVRPGAEGDPDEGWRIPSGTRRFTFAGGAGDFGFEGFTGAIGWASPNTVFGGAPPAVASTDLKNVVLVLANTDLLGNYSLADTNVSYGYRYGRNFTAAPAQPSFAPFMVNTTGAGYLYQDFTQSVPLSAWDIESNPPRRLAVGHLENNVTAGLVDGKWWPPDFNVANNTASSGPREWLFVFNTDYSTTPNSAFEVEATGNPLPIMYFLTVARRGDVAFSPGGTGEDQFEIIDAEVNSVADSFSFTSTPPSFVSSGPESLLDNIKAVPNPYYLFSNYDNNSTNRIMKFTNLPDVCSISIYNLAGQFITRIEKNDATTSEATWAVTNDFNVPVASGIYIYVVEAPGFGQKIGKLAIFTEIEILGQY